MPEERTPNPDELLGLVDVGATGYVLKDKFRVLCDVWLQDLLLAVVCLQKQPSRKETLARAKATSHSQHPDMVAVGALHVVCNVVHDLRYDVCASVGFTEVALVAIVSIDEEGVGVDANA